ncbi:MAG: hypothetical protein MK226_20080 [Saprospiraceae bacterium]|jgi:hypothetical protein|nr:hypothetical protein [Saprospiraceae bacterium]
MKFTTIKLMGFGLIMMFGVSSCQSFNCGCPMAEVEESERMKRKKEKMLGLDELVIKKLDDKEMERMNKGEVKDSAIAK